MNKVLDYKQNQKEKWNHSQSLNLKEDVTRARDIKEIPMAVDTAELKKTSNQ